MCERPAGRAAACPRLRLGLFAFATFALAVARIMAGTWSFSLVGVLIWDYGHWCSTTERHFRQGPGTHQLRPWLTPDGLLSYFYHGSPLTSAPPQSTQGLPLKAQVLKFDFVLEINARSLNGWEMFSHKGARCVDDVDFEGGPFC